MDLVAEPLGEEPGDVIHADARGEAGAVALVEVADERDPAVVGKRREQDEAARTGDEGKGIARQGTSESHVGGERDTRVRVALERLVHRLARERVCAAGADDIGGFDSLRRAVRPLEADAHRVHAGLDRRDRDPPLDGDAHRGQMGGDDLLGPPLGQAREEGPGTVDAAEARPAERREIGTEHERVVQVHCRRQDWVGEPRELEDFECSGLNAGGAGLPVRRRLPLHHASPDAVPRELGSGEQPGGPGADDEDVHGHASYAIATRPRVRHLRPRGRARVQAPRRPASGAGGIRPTG